MIARPRRKSQPITAPNPTSAGWAASRGSRRAKACRAGSTWLLPRLVGLARARELSLLAERLPAETALSWGLINRVCDDAELMPEALRLATKLADGPTQALAMTRTLYSASPTNSFEAQIDLERAMQSAAGKTEDFVEGVMAFLQKRPAKFKGT